MSLCIYVSIFAQCLGGDPPVDGPVWDTNLTVQGNFNQAHRWEEEVLDLPPFCLGYIAPPAGDWGSMTDVETAYYLHTLERVSRGLTPLEGQLPELDALAEDHSYWLINEDVFSHGGDNFYGESQSYFDCNNQFHFGSSPFDRIDSDPNLRGCWETASENIGIEVSTAPIAINFGAKAIYDMIYRNTNTAWGHRHNVLRQYNNNNGNEYTEGYLGIGIASGSNFRAHSMGCVNWNYTEVITIKFYDPRPGCSFGLLPVEWLSFTANLQQGEVILNWATAKEEQSSHFIIEHSTDGALYRALGQVPAQGNSQRVNTYQHTLKAPENGVHYYRLQQLDIDGGYTYSSVRKLIIGQVKPLLQVFPNPFTGNISLRFPIQSPEEEANIALRNASGKLLLSTQGNSTQLQESINTCLQHQAAGTYFLRWSNKQSATSTILVKY